MWPAAPSRCCGAAAGAEVSGRRCARDFRTSGCSAGSVIAEPTFPRWSGWTIRPVAGTGGTACVRRIDRPRFRTPTGQTDLSAVMIESVRRDYGTDRELNDRRQRGVAGARTGAHTRRVRQLTRAFLALAERPGPRLSPRSCRRRSPSVPSRRRARRPAASLEAVTCTPTPAPPGRCMRYCALGAAVAVGACTVRWRPTARPCGCVHRGGHLGGAGGHPDTCRHAGGRRRRDDDDLAGAPAWF